MSKVLGKCVSAEHLFHFSVYLQGNFAEGSNGRHDEEIRLHKKAWIKLFFVFPKRTVSFLVKYRHLIKWPKICLKTKLSVMLPYV